MQSSSESLILSHGACFIDVINCNGRSGICIMPGIIESGPVLRLKTVGLLILVPSSNF